jgi:ABC-type antimicrobial peptide transport system permease subunit
MSVFTTELIQKASGEAISIQQVQKNHWLVAMSLLVSVVGITNSMLMSVTERYKEIGTMKCLGALDNFIVKLFLLESGMLGFFGALIGALVGGLFMLLTRLSVLGSLDWLDFISKLLLCIIIGTVLSVVGAVIPSMRAARMQPADAMRSEI